MKLSTREKILHLPVLGYCVRIAASFLHQPRTNDAVAKRFEEQHELLRDIESQLRNDLQKTKENFELREDRLERIETQLRLVDGRLADIAHEMSQTKRPAPTKVRSGEQRAAQSESTLLADDHTLDQFYIEFENKFRGKEADIQKRLEIYLPYVKNDKKNAASHPVIDIGCGRGEFIKLLKEHKVPAKGLDLNESMVKRAKEQGLDVVQADAMQYLHELPSSSVRAITGFHIVEHIPFAALLRLMDECFRAIQPDGYAIFETPNPENLLVGTHNFYYDPSHLNPIPPALMAFVMETRGFSHVEIKRLHPMKTGLETDDPLVRQMAERMYGPSDYAIIARK